MKKLLKRRPAKTRLDFKAALALALLPGVMLMVLQTIFLKFNVYLWYFPNLDVLMHIMGGAAVAWAALALVSYAQQAKKLPPLPFWFVVSYCVGVAITVGALWEFYEFLHDVFYQTHEQLSQFGVGDTMKDLDNDLIGGLVLSVLLGRKMLEK